MDTDLLVPLELGVSPEAAVSGACCYQTECDVILTFNAMRPTDRPSPYGGFYKQEAGTAICTFKRCLLTRFGYPNDEARWGIPRFTNLEHDIYEIRNSSWIKDIVTQNRHRFPSTPDDCVAKHYLFTFHDSTFECLADDLDVEVSSDGYEIIMKKICDQIH
ncbi:MAG: hypothetical protein AAF711_03700 [Planctomycetota bacterium]